jgi:hypothetical protein
MDGTPGGRALFWRLPDSDEPPAGCHGPRLVFNQHRRKLNAGRLIAAASGLRVLDSQAATAAYLLRSHSPRPSLLGLRGMGLQPKSHCGCPVVNVVASIKARKMRPQGVRGHGKHYGDFLIGQTRRDEPQDIVLPWRKVLHVPRRHPEPPARILQGVLRSHRLNSR